MISTVLRYIKNIALSKAPTERALKKLFAIKLNRTDIAIDCGANVGDITEHLSKSGATVYAFEPNPHAYMVLQDRFSNKGNVHCFQKAVSDKNDTMKLYLHENSDKDEVYWSTGSSLLVFKGNVLPDKYVGVEVVDICEFIENINHRVRILKLDIEGVECKVLKKLIYTGVIDKIDFVYVETHDDKIPELREETNAIRKLINERGISNIDLDWI